MGAMLMAIVTEGSNGRSYYSPTDEHSRVANVLIPDDAPRTALPEKALGFRVQAYGMDEHYKLFTPRQLVALTTFSDLVHEARQQAYADARAAGLADDGVPLRDGGRGALAYAEAVSVYLALAVDKGADNWSVIASWRNSVDSPRTTFARQAIPMVWDFAETNPFSSLAGSWNSTIIDVIYKALLALPATETGYAEQKPAQDLQAQTVVLSTDPPYYDNIGYADLSDFFYIWLRRALRGVYPDLFSTLLVPKADELIASPYRHGSQAAAKAHFEGGMAQAFGNIRRFAHPDYPLTVYYAFKQQEAEEEEEPLTLNPSPTRGEGLENAAASPSPAAGSGAGGQGVGGAAASTGWETMLSSLIEVGFSLVGTWPMRTERSARSNSLDANALASSIALVCRPRPADAPTISRRAFLDALRRELPAALRAMQSGSIAPVDLAQASIGPGMAIYSRCSRVLEADGSPMSVRTALGLINAALDEYLAEQDGDIDPDTRFAVAWFEQFGFDEGEFGVADVLARAKNTSVAGVEAAGLVVSGRGKVRLIHWTEYDPSNAPLTLNPASPSPLRGSGGQGVRGGEGWDPAQDQRPTVWEATHHLIERLRTHGETGSALLMHKLPPDMAAAARNLAYRLYSICERKGWAEHAQDYNALVISWAGIGEEAARLRQADESGQALRQMGLFDA